MIRITILTLIYLVCFSIEAENLKSPDVIRLSKESFIMLFIENSDMIKSFSHDTSVAEIDKQIAVAGNFPRLSFVLGTGPHPEYIYHPNKLEKINGEYFILKETWEKHPYDISKYGVAIRTNAKLSIPVYTISKNMNLYKYHTSKIDALKLRKNIEVMNIKKEAAIYYWSWIRLNEDLRTTEYALSELSKVEKELKKLLYNETGNISQKDLIRLRIRKTKLEYKSESLKLHIGSLRTLINQAINLQKWELADSITDIPPNIDLSTKVSSFTTSDLQEMKTLTMKNCFKMEQARFLPDINILTDLSWKYTSSVKEKDYPHSESPYNDTTVSLFLNFTFDQNYLERYRKIQKIKFRLESEKARLAFINHLNSISLKKKINDLESLKNKVDHLKKIRTMLADALTKELSEKRTTSTYFNDLTEDIFMYLETEQEIVDTSFKYMVKIEEIYVLTGKRELF